MWITLKSIIWFLQTVDILCRRCRLVLLERIQDTASLYGSTSSGHHLCFLLKLEPKRRTMILDAKCNSENLLMNFMKELKPLFSVWPSYGRQFKNSLFLSYLCYLFFMNELNGYFVSLKKTNHFIWTCEKFILEWGWAYFIIIRT